jgi:hypothetical protein
MSRESSASRKTRLVVRALVIGSVACCWVAGALVARELLTSPASVKERLVSPRSTAILMALGLPALGMLLAACALASCEFLLSLSTLARRRAAIVGKRALAGPTSPLEARGSPQATGTGQLIGAGASTETTSVAGVRAPRDEVRRLRDAIARGRWQEAYELLSDLLERFPGDTAVERLAADYQTQRNQHVAELKLELQRAQADGDPQRVLNVRDRLAMVLELDECRQLDKEVARWSMTFLREALHEGRARDLIGVIERMVETFGETTQEGAELKSALPILRRSAGRCPDCGQPYDIALERCSACETKRRARSRSASPSAPSDGSTATDGNGQADGPRP